MAERVLTIWTIFDHPRDQPDFYVVRGFDVERGGGDPVPQEAGYLFRDLDHARSWLAQEHPGLACIGREPEDDRSIVESWV